ncbi:MAG: hypothetical protein QOG10_5252 [Kribbellaceae bacterium]|nr:hypothetical protein [Kribbellaceae bacterium]
MREAAWLLVLSTILWGLLFWQRRAVARRDVGRLVKRAGLPAAPELVAAAEDRFTRRQAALTVGACIAHFNMLRSGRAGGPRAASLRQRRLLDFLTPAEVAVQYGLLTLPLLTGVLGVLTLAGDDHPQRGWALIAAAAGAVLIVAGSAALQRWALRASQPSGGEVELRWEEATRAAMLRDLSAVAVGSSWALGGLTGYSAAIDWPGRYPGFVVSLAIGLYLLGTLALAWVVLASAIGRKTLSRSQQVIG